MRTSLPLSFAKLILICCFAILAMSSAFAQVPVHVGFTLQGCRFYAGITLPDSFTPPEIICHPDDPGKPDDAYTDGNQGKGWAELGLVPFRLTTTTGNQANVTTDYQITIAADFQDNTANNPDGFDIISQVQVDPESKTPSDGSCSVTTSTQIGPAPITNSPAGGVGQNLTGGALNTIYEIVKLHQAAGTTCYWAWWQRLAIGSHLFNGSSLQSYLFQGVFQGGKETVPLPVVPCSNNQPNCVPSPAPQSISKDMTATANGPENTWNLNGTGPGNLTANTCDPHQLTQSGLKFTITWSAVANTAAPGVNIVTHVYATNPSPSLVYVQVSDVITGTPDGFAPPAFVTGGTGTGGIPVPANSSNLLIATDTISDPAGDLSDTYSDTATASYWDVLGNAGGSAQASAGPITPTSSSAKNTSATINNLENITGTDINFSTDSATPNTLGAFDGGYPSGTFPADEVPLNWTIQPVSWTSNLQDAATVEGSGPVSVVFSKSVYLPSATATTETLTDNSTLTTSPDGVVVNMSPGPLSVMVDAAPTVSLTITKNISQAVATDQTFTFHVCKTTDYTTAGNLCNSTNELVTPPTITIAAGSTTNNSSGISLLPDNYTVTEDPLAGWTTDAPQAVNDAPNASTGVVNCSPTATFSNTLAGANLQVSKTASASFTRKYKWTILKSVNPARIEQVGGNATFNYTVTVSHDAGTDSGWQVKGTITVKNPNSVDFTGVNVTDTIDNTGSCSLDSAFNGTVSANSSVNLPYTCTYTSAPSPTSGTNTATATWSGSFPTPDTSAQGTHGYAFGSPTTVQDDSVTVTDSFNGGAAIALGTVNLTTTTPNTNSTTDGGLTITSSGYGIFNYSRTVPVPASGCKEYDNTATFTTNTNGITGTANAAATVCGSGKTGALTMGFWQNKNGQGIIAGSGPKTGTCSLTTWLRQYTPFQDLSATAPCGKVGDITPSTVVGYVYTVIKNANAGGAAMNAMLKAQMLATALDVYFGGGPGGDPISGFNGGVTAQIGLIAIDLTKVCNMIDSSNGTGSCTGTPKYIDTSAAFVPLACPTTTVSNLLSKASSFDTVAGGLSGWYLQNKTTQGLAKNTFDAINNQAAFTCP